MAYRLALRFLGVSALAIGTLPACAQEFSAELVHLKPPSDLKSKVLVRGEKMRFEIEGQKRTSVAIIDVATRVSLMMIPDNKTYVKSINAHAAIPLFQITNPEEACAAWEKSTERAGTCTKVGDDTINGRSAVKYKGTSDNGETGYVWIDRKLKSVIKWEGETPQRNCRTSRRDRRKPRCSRCRRVMKCSIWRPRNKPRRTRTS